MKKSNVSFMSQMCKIILNRQNIIGNKNLFFNINYICTCSNLNLGALVLSYFHYFKDKKYLCDCNYLIF